MISSKFHRILVTLKKNPEKELFYRQKKKKLYRDIDTAIRTSFLIHIKPFLKNKAARLNKEQIRRLVKLRVFLQFFFTIQNK